MRLIWKLALRLVSGVLLIWLINGLLPLTQGSGAVGINGYSLGLLAVLGVPALIICYGLSGL